MSILNCCINLLLRHKHDALVGEHTENLLGRLCNPQKKLEHSIDTSPLSDDKENQANPKIVGTSKVRLAAWIARFLAQARRCCRPLFDSRGTLSKWSLAERKRDPV